MFYRDHIEHWLRFGTQARERIIDRRRRVIAFAPGEVFGFVRWHANDYGTVLSRIDIVHACAPGERIATIPGIAPGGDILLRLTGWPRVRQAFAAVAAVERLGIDPADVAPEWWRHVHSRILCNAPWRPYTRLQHAAWLRRRTVLR